MSTALVPAIQEERKDNDLEMAERLHTFIALNEEDGWTAAELSSRLKFFRRDAQFIYYIYIMKKYLMADDEYPFVEVKENQISPRIKILKEPNFKELPEGVLQQLLKDPNASFVRDHRLRIEWSILGYACLALTQNGLEGSFRWMSSNYTTAEIFLIFQYKELWEAKPDDSLCTEIQLYDDKELVANAMMEQIRDKDGRQAFRATLIASSKSTISEKTKLLDSMDKVDSDGRANNTGGTNIQINVLGADQIDVQKAEVIDGD